MFIVIDGEITGEHREKGCSLSPAVYARRVRTCRIPDTSRTSAALVSARHEYAILCTRNLASESMNYADHGIVYTTCARTARPDGILRCTAVSD
jgi:hypothetical protein